MCIIIKDDEKLITWSKILEPKVSSTRCCLCICWSVINCVDQDIEQLTLDIPVVIEKAA